MSEAGEWAVRAPHPALRPLVTRYIGYVQQDCVPAVHRGLPSRHLTLVLSLEQPVRILRMPGEQPPADLYGFVGGLHTNNVLIGQDGRQRGVHIELNPLGVRRLLGASSAELSGYVIDLADLDRPELAELPDRLRRAPDWSRRFEILDAVLLAAAAGSGAAAPAPEVAWAWRRLLAEGGRSAVSALAAEVGWSRRHFTDRFRSEVGLAPKQAARVLRFERACDSLRSRPRQELAELALACGYYDQPHLNNEWRAIAGCSPRAWIVEELPFLQYDDEHARAFSTV